MSKILIAGCGDVGGALGARLLAAGHQVWGLRRRVDALPDGIRPLAADLTDPASLHGLPDGLDYVVYTAAAEGFSEAAYQDAYDTGVANLLAALTAGKQPVRRVLFASSTAVYAQGDGQWVDEDSPTEPVHFSGRNKLAGERRVLGGPYPAAVVRFGGIYGPGRNRLIEGVRRGEPCAETPPVYTNRIHRDDCAGALYHLLHLDHPAPVYLGVDHQPAPQCEVMDWLAGRLGAPAPPRTKGEAALSRQRSNKRCRNDRLLASGYEFLYPTYREGYAAVLAADGQVS